MADQRILQFQLFLFQAHQQAFVGVWPVLLGVDLSVERGVFRCECLDIGFVHRSISSRWLTRDSGVNKSRNAPPVAPDPTRLGWLTRRFADDAVSDDGNARFL